MKAILIAVFFTAQLFSHVMFLNDVSGTTYGSIEGITETDYHSEYAPGKEYSSAPGFTMNGNVKKEEILLQRTSDDIPTGYYLGQNSANQSDKSTNIYFSIPGQQHVRLIIMNMLGQEIMELINSDLNAGTYKLNFDAAGVSSGLYVYRFETEGFFDSKKMMLVK